MDDPSSSMAIQSDRKTLIDQVGSPPSPLVGASLKATFKMGKTNKHNSREVFLNNTNRFSMMFGRQNL